MKIKNVEIDNKLNFTYFFRIVILINLNLYFVKINNYFGILSIYNIKHMSVFYGIDHFV